MLNEFEIKLKTFGYTIFRALYFNIITPKIALVFT